MSANIQFTETVNLLSPDKADRSGFSDPSYISARCRFAPRASSSQAWYAPVVCRASGVSGGLYAAVIDRRW